MDRSYGDACIYALVIRPRLGETEQKRLHIFLGGFIFVTVVSKDSEKKLSLLHTRRQGRVAFLVQFKYSM